MLVHGLKEDKDESSDLVLNLFNENLGGAVDISMIRADQNTAAHFWNFLSGLSCTGNLAFRLQYLLAIINKIS